MKSTFFEKKKKLREMLDIVSSLHFSLDTRTHNINSFEAYCLVQSLSNIYLSNTAPLSLLQIAVWFRDCLPRVYTEYKNILGRKFSVVLFWCHHLGYRGGNKKEELSRNPLRTPVGTELPDWKAAVSWAKKLTLSFLKMEHAISYTSVVSFVPKQL